MPRGRRSSFNDAQEILQQLIKDGRVSAGDVARFREIRQLEQRLQALRGGGGGAARGRRRRGRPAASSSGLSAGQRASRQLQGRYLALVRQIPANRRAQYSTIARERGREAAIRAMQSAVGSRGGSSAAPKAAGKRRRRRASKLTPQQMASRKLQGRYLGLIRQIPAGQRPRYAKLAKDKGREAAIKDMESAVKK